MFPRCVLDELTSDLSLRDLIQREPARNYHLAVTDEGVLLDMDTPEDYDKIRRMADISNTAPHKVALYGREGEEIRVAAGATGVRFLLLAGRPLGEPIAWQGLIVMNTADELRIAFEEFHSGKFIK